MVSKERKEREKDRRRNEIVDVAERLFLSGGYENITMDDIAKEMGLSRATIYLTFQNKEEIYIDVAYRGAKLLNEMFKTCTGGKTSGMEQVKAYITAFRDFNRKFPGYLVATWYSQTVVYGDNPYPKALELRDVRTENFGYVVEAFREGIRDGTVRTDTDPYKATLYLMSAMLGALNLTPAVAMHIKNLGFTQEDFVEYTIDQLVKAFKNDG
jgi:AcrR family transcriptional regulator